MIHIFFLVTTFFYFPLTLGILARQSQKDSGRDLGALRYLLTKYKHANEEIKYIISFAIALWLMAPLAVYSKITNGQSTITNYIFTILILILLLASLKLLIAKKYLKEFSNKFKVTLGLVLTWLVAINTVTATKYADSSIVKLTGTLATDLPTAFVWLNLIFIPLAWVLTICWVLLMGYIVTMFYSSRVDAKVDITSILNCPPPKKNYLHTPEAGLGIAAICMMIIAVILISLVLVLTKSTWAEKNLRAEIIKASFHLKGSACGFKKYADSPLALIDKERGVIAIPHDMYGYEFKRVKCSMDWQSVETIEAPKDSPK